MMYRETSRAAWEGFAPPASAKLDDQILAALTHVGRATCQEVETALNRSHQAVSGNLRHLVERGLVRPSGYFGKTKSGRRAIEWEIVPVAERVAQVEAAKSAKSDEPDDDLPLQVRIQASDEQSLFEALGHTIGALIKHSRRSPLTNLRTMIGAYFRGLRSA